MNDSGEIIIKGGSVEVIFDAESYQKDLRDSRSYRHNARRIVRIVVSDDGDIIFDSGDNPQGMNCIVRVVTEPV
jgi:hypothetical protein